MRFVRKILSCTMQVYCYWGTLVAGFACTSLHFTSRRNTNVPSRVRARSLGNGFGPPTAACKLLLRVSPGTGFSVFGAESDVVYAAGPNRIRSVAACVVCVYFTGRKSYFTARRLTTSTAFATV